jgi:hypothetical protein
MDQVQVADVVQVEEVPLAQVMEVMAAEPEPAQRVLRVRLTKEQLGKFADRYGPTANGTRPSSYPLLMSEAQLGCEFMTDQGPMATIGFNSEIDGIPAYGLRFGLYDNLPPPPSQLPPHVAMMTLGVTITVRQLAAYFDGGVTCMDVWCPLIQNSALMGHPLCQGRAEMPTGPMDLTLSHNLVGSLVFRTGWFGLRTRHMYGRSVFTSDHGIVVRITPGDAQQAQSHPAQPGPVSQGKPAHIKSTRISTRRGLLWDSAPVRYDYVEELAAEAARRAGVRPLTTQLHSDIVTSVGQFAMGFALPLDRRSQLVEHSVEVGLTLVIESRRQRALVFYAHFVQ